MISTLLSKLLPKLLSKKISKLLPERLRNRFSSLSKTVCNDRRFFIVNGRIVRFETRPQAQSGFSLIEVMIASLVVSIGMLGIAGLQLVGMKGSHQSYMRHQATFMVNDLVERMRANPDGVKAAIPAYVFDTADTGGSAPNCLLPPAKNCGINGADCDSAELAAYDKHNLACKMGDSLINGRMRVACQAAGGGCANGRVTVEVSWTERALGKETLSTINPLDLTETRTDNILLNTSIE